MLSYKWAITQTSCSSGERLTGLEIAPARDNKPILSVLCPFPGAAELANGDHTQSYTCRKDEAN